MSRNRDVRKKRSAGSAGTLVSVAEAAMGGPLILTLRAGAALEAARNDNVYSFNDSSNEYGFAAVPAESASAARAILRVRFEIGSVEKSFNGMLFAPRMRGIFAMATRKGRTVTLR